MPQRPHQPEQSENYQQPENKGGAAGEKGQGEAQKRLNRAAVTLHGRVMKLRTRGRWRDFKLRLVLFAQPQLKGGKANPVFQALLFCLHTLDIAADARDLLLHRQDVPPPCPYAAEAHR